MGTLIEKAELGKLLAETRLFELDAELRTLEVTQATFVAEQAKATISRTRTLDLVGVIVDESVFIVTKALAALRALSTEPIIIRLNSPGGEVTAGLALYDYLQTLRRDGVKIRMEVYGEAASMAGVLLQAADERYMAPNAFLLVHEVSAGVAGKLSEMQEYEVFVKRQQDICLDILSSRCAVTRATIARRWRKRDWWLRAPEAVKLGFADGVLLQQAV